MITKRKIINLDKIFCEYLVKENHVVNLIINFKMNLPK